MNALAVDGDNLFMGKFVLSKGRLYMALVAAIDQLCDRVVGNSGNVGVTLPAIDESVNAFVIKLFINVIIPAFAVGIDSADESMPVAHETIFFIRRPGLETEP